MKIYFILFLFISLFFNATAQNRNRIIADSLYLKLSISKEDTDKVKILNTLSSNFGTMNSDSGIIFGTQALELASKLNYISGIGWANNNIGNNYRVKSNFQKGLDFCTASVKVFEKTGNTLGLATALGNIGIIYAMQGNYDKSLEYLLITVKKYEEIGDKNNSAKFMSNIGNIYKEKGEYAVAIDYYFKALKLAEEFKNKNLIANIYGNLGSVYQYENDYDKALDYDNKSLEILSALGNKNGEATIISNMAHVYTKQLNYNMANEYYFKALTMAEEIGNKKLEAGIIGNISAVYSYQKNHIMAITFSKKALEKAELLGDKINYATALGQIGAAYLNLVKDTIKYNDKIISLEGNKMNKYLPDGTIPESKSARLQLAFNYLQRGLDSSIKLNLKETIKDLNQCLAEAYEYSGDFKKAYVYYKKYVVLKDSIFSDENEKKMMKTAMHYETNKIHIIDSMKNAEKEKISALKLEKQRGYTYWSFAAVLILLIFSFFIVKERKKSETLLLNILPKEVAYELKKKGSAEAKYFNQVTVIFTDFVGFTKVSERLSPQELIEELHCCFKKFDEITHKYNIEKIKTIGDAYLAVAGLPVEDENHAENIIKAALEMAEFMKDRRQLLGDKTFEIRLGVHSGKVVAGIVGVRKFVYDIWGDTVNIAARMEQNSIAGKINISQTTYELIKDKYKCTYRGEIEAKNKGKLSMYFID